MSNIRELLNSPIEQLVEEIKAINHAWKSARELFGEDFSLSTSARDLKTCLQVRLLQSYAPAQVYLTLDKETNASEPLYGLVLREPIGNWHDADHLPVRRAKEVLTEQEIKQFLEE